MTNTNLHQEHESDLTLENICVVHHIIRLKEKNHAIIHMFKKSNAKTQHPFSIKTLSKLRTKLDFIL